jgi:radical SAM superfamily enzyme YgiQ (UPF0313 family)
VTLIDCLDFPIRRKEYRDGKFYKIKMEKPQPVKSIPRNYSRYGIPEGMLLEKFSSMERPDVMGITSGMTYWYPGLFKAVEMTREFFKDVPIVIGGIYATLCYEHAKKYSGVDIVFNGREEFEALKLITELTNIELKTPNSELILSPLSTFILNSIMSVSPPRGDAHFVVPIVPPRF